MPRSDRAYLVALLVFALVSCLPWTRGIRIVGWALFDWLMAALMVLPPAVALMRL